MLNKGRKKLSSLYHHIKCFLFRGFQTKHYPLKNTPPKKNKTTKYRETRKKWCSKWCLTNDFFSLVSFTHTSWSCFFRVVCRYLAMKINFFLLSFFITLCIVRLYFDRFVFRSSRKMFIHCRRMMICFFVFLFFFKFFSSYFGFS